MASEVEKVNAYLNANPGRNGAAVAAYTEWVVWYASHKSSTADADVKRALQLRDAFDVAQGGSPLAPGYYWLDLLGAEAQNTFFAWARAYGVKVVKTTDDVAAGRAWVLFQVPAGVYWALGTALGRPTPGTKDTDVNAAGGAEPTPDVLDQLADKLSVDNLAKGVGTTAVVVGVLGVLALVGVAIYVKKVTP